MAINLPDNPQINDIFTYANRSWKWNGIAWIAVYTNDMIDGGTA